MTNLTERKRLADRHEAFKAEGLVDVKFLLGNPAEATNEEVCREVSALYEALDRKEFKVLDFGDRSPILH